MNARFAVAFLAVVASTGCVVVAKSPGDVTFSWTFAGKTCAENPSVRSVVITIPGEKLNKDGVYSCLDDTGYPGVTLFNFDPGSYSYTIKALDSTGTSLFTGSGSFSINGNKRVDIDLTPAGGPNSFAYLTWSFPNLSGAVNPNNATCTEAGISNVKLSIDGVAPTTIKCSDGRGTSPGVQTPFLEAGTHTVTASAVDSAGYEYFFYSGTMKTMAGNPMINDLPLDWSVGGVAIKWQLSDSAGPLTCGMAGVTDMYVNFEDSTGHLVYPSTATVPGDKKPCNSSGVAYDYLKPGTYKVQLTAFGTGTSVYQETLPAVTVTAVAGVFKDIPTQSTNVPMTRVQ